jgi:LPS sulfotransferase NodH
MTSSRPSGDAGTVPFVLLCHARTGSNLVLRALSAHRDVCMYGEVLNHDEQSRVALAKDSPDPRVMYRTGQDATAFLDQQIYGSVRRRATGAVGFKMFYEYARWQPEMRTAWRYLVDRSDIRVIHLTRLNLLDCIVSHKVAEMTGQWYLEGGKRMPGKRGADPFWLNAEECHTYFDRIVTWRMWVARAMKDHAMLEIEYERDLCEDFGGTMERIHNFLGVSRRKAQVELAKQRTRSPSEQLENYDELREHFRNTLYEEFFPDNGER